jgi:polyphosphate kinase
LEHARIFYFKHSNPNLFISSADWMPRNLERRLELMTPIEDKTLQKKLFEILQVQLSDNILSWQLKEDGAYEHQALKDDKEINCQQMLEEYINRIYRTMKKDTTSSKADQLAKKLFKES